MKKSYRVKSEKDFQTVFNKGDSVANRAFVVYKLIRPENKHFRVGISVGKKVGHTAVVRNRLKRYIRATLTEVKDEVDVKADFLVITRPYARKFTMAEVKKNLIHAMTLAKLINQDSEENEGI
ncbi:MULTISPECIES: ribonuclease P protein component [Lactobacillus]|uniref:Ribonuclease P protein component n=1 Tax=Lactobacillus mulieris TaxID=2508708 RepID=A0AAP3GSD2_9LACO|nr:MULTISPECIES: ribonuclease P protein component [Lactobacillus]EEU20819.1 ribonuclease P protein component [Lactobacillus jensenii 27-2-CHN]EEX23646.1 ribonuclease P protein component [Lactobacillus jensenii 115-3-CHN]EFH30156.1 ribonuclease P protein component [Lactobacillus jensenii JV-V16]KAA9244072.1 ribonuclease P protein component [Lactobacillus jensenii]MCT7689419.1 ribonuclease P protein component [Lactobacillus crispatus]